MDIKIFFKRYRKKFLIFLVAALIFSVIGEVWDFFDSSQRQARHFLITNSDVHEQLGSISNYALHKSTYVAATKNQPPYREYLYFVEGSKKKARVIIRVDRPTEKGKEHYSIVEITSKN